MKNHTYKKSSLVLYIYTCLLEEKEIHISDIIALGASRATAYNVMNEIKIFIAEFNLYYMELIVKKGYYEIKIKK